MPSSFTSNIGIEKPADGEQVGAWGDTVNDNMDILDRLTSQVGSIALTGTTKTLATSTSGALSEGHYSLIKFTGTPGGACTVTIAPNTVERIYTIYNSTDQTVVMSQGSGSTVSIPSGKVARVYSDGAGSGAAVTQLTDKLSGVLSDGDLGVTVQGYDADLAAIGALAKTDGNFIVGNGSTWVAESGNTALQSLGVTATAAELNVLDGVTATTAEINKLDGATVSTAELNLLDGVTWTLADYNALTATATELNLLDGITARTGSDTEVVTGTAGTDGQLAQWDANGDVVGVNKTLAEATWETGTDTTESLVSPAKVKAAIEALAAGGFGVGQTWQSVSRSSGTTYQNTTGKPIAVSVTSAESSTAVSLSIGATAGSLVAVSRAQGAQLESTCYGVVPPDHYYRYNGQVAAWTELR